MEQAVADAYEVVHPTNVAQILELYRPESHAREALLHACRHNRDHRLDARAVLWGVLEAPQSGGTAFRKFRELVGQEAPREDRSASPVEVLLNLDLEESLRVARAFWRERGALWGRDLVTWALLANDRSLEEWLRADVLKALRDRWFEFVAGEDGPEMWARWWKEAGIALPHADTAAVPEIAGATLSPDSLTPEARKALAYANAFHAHGEVHLDDLMWGLLYATEEDTSRASRLRQVGITAKQLAEVLDDASADARVRPAHVPEVSGFPPLSRHAEQALHQALEIQVAKSKLVDEQLVVPLLDTDAVLQGLLRVQTSDVARAVLGQWPALLEGKIIAVEGASGKIPDAGKDSLTVAVLEKGTVSSVQVQIAIVHPRRDDLQLSLLSPAGQRVVLSDRQGGDADNLSIDLTSATHAGLRQFAGGSAHGVWQLVVEDATSNDVGRLDAWRLTLFVVTSDSSPTARADIRDVAQFGGDVPPTTGDIIDCLKVQDEAHAFARIAAALAIRPPLAIGVFGEWGAGKTFFMELMYRHVEVLKAQTTKHTTPAKEREQTFHSEIVQIRFNAWHYMESNLWASLVDYILTELDRWLQQQDNKDPAAVDALLGKLLTAQELELDAVRKTIAAHQERKRAQDRLTHARTALEKARLSSDLWNAVQDTLNQELSKGEREELDKAAEELGVARVTESVRELAGLIEQASTVSRQARIVFASVLSKVLANRLLALVVLVAMFGLPPFIWWWKTRASPDWVQHVSELTASLVGVIAPVTATLLYYLTRAQAALNTLFAFRSNLDAAVKKTRANPAFVEAQTELAKAEADVAGVVHAVADASRAVQDAQMEWHASTPRGRLNDFIRAKVVNGDYAKHLGIVAAIRRDFEHLAHIMAEQDDEQAERDYKRVREEHEREVARLIEEGRGLLTTTEMTDLQDRIQNAKQVERSDLRAFERIILYIDDLDRCPEDKVVDVLQAIHLLLYFPLFVVVVAVDARWVSRALQTRFPNLLSENLIYDESRVGATQPERSPLPRASSLDYLEKIFQIPYWVRPMDRNASTHYVTHLLKGHGKKALGTSKPSTGNGHGLEPAAHGVELMQASKLAKPAAHSRAATAGTASTRTTAAAPSPSEREPASAPVPSTPDSGSQSLSAEQLEEQKRIEARSLTLTEHEEKLLEAMAPFAGDSPRRGLRFVNIYRLVRTSLDEAQRDALVGNNGEKLGFKALITQLAIATGAPEFSQRYFEALAKKPASLKVLLQAAMPGSSLSESPAWQRLAGAVDVLSEQTVALNPQSEQELLDLLCVWGAVARRYSFSARPH